MLVTRTNENCVPALVSFEPLVEQHTRICVFPTMDWGQRSGRHKDLCGCFDAIGDIGNRTSKALERLNIPSHLPS
jgi:hypothetical protein